MIPYTDTDVFQSVMKGSSTGKYWSPGEQYNISYYTTNTGTVYQHKILKDYPVKRDSQKKSGDHQQTSLFIDRSFNGLRTADFR